MSQPLNVALLWHMHQPYYRDALTGESILPWVRLHALKNYYDIPSIGAEFPDIKQTFNLVPSLIKQIEEYAHRGESDAYLELSEKPVEHLSPEERDFLIRHFFQANVDTMIAPYPGYQRLLDIRGRFISVGDQDAAAQRYSNQELLDLQVWFNLSWSGHHIRELPEVARLFRKGSNFTVDEKRNLLHTQRRFLQDIVPLYRYLQESGQIEISVSPFYHPILPLLCDSDEAAVAMPEAPLPEPAFRHPDDARKHIQRSIEFYRDRFGRDPVGMWPSEGSVSSNIVPLVAEAGFKWMATDDAVLTQSLMKEMGTGHEHLEPTAVQRYRPYTVTRLQHQISMIFRDHLLSDHVGFVYSRWDPEDAADDMIRRLHEIRHQLPSDRPAVVPIILDGENAWEYYADHGRPFLRALYQRLSDAEEIRTVTVQEAILEQPGEPLNHLHSGSWIDHSYATWIGHREKNAAWDRLAAARGVIRQYEETPERAMSRQALRQARECLYIAEGSDWFWWYGDDHVSENDEQFDRLFRNHVANIYRALGEPVPDVLNRPIRQPHETVPTRMPVGPITPSLDGKSTNYYEWLQAGYFDVKGGRGSMHQADSFLKRIYYGFDEHSLHLRIDTAADLSESQNRDMGIRIRFQLPVKHLLVIGRFGQPEYRVRLDGKDVSGARTALGKHIELSTSLHDLNAGFGDELGFEVELFRGGHLWESWPDQGTVRIKVPDPQAGENWIV